MTGIGCPTHQRRTPDATTLHTTRSIRQTQSWVSYRGWRCGRPSPWCGAELRQCENDGAELPPRQWPLPLPEVNTRFLPPKHPTGAVMRGKMPPRKPIREDQIPPRWSSTAPSSTQIARSLEERDKGRENPCHGFIDG
jgi:hypothetical protein